MRPHALLLAGVLGLVVAGACRADQAKHTAAPPSPLRLVPAEADLVLQVQQPRRVADLIGKLELLPRVLELPAVREQLDATAARRGRQLLAYAEKTLGHKWPELLDRLAGGGLALAAKFGDRAPALLIVQGKDEKLMKRFVELAADFLEAELARQESKEKLQKQTFAGLEGFHVGNDLWVARAGAALVVSNRKEALARAVALHLGKEKKSLAHHPPQAAAGKLLPPAPLAQAWLNLKPIKQGEGAKALYRTPRDNAPLTVLFGGYIDVIGRSDWLCAGLAHDDEGFVLRIAAPAGRDGMGVDRLLHLPPGQAPGCRPLLEPKGVLYSASFYRDVASIWKERDKLFVKAQADALTNLDRTSGRVLLGNRLGKLLESVGPYHRLVVVNQARPGYQKRSKVTIPAFAFIPELRDPDRFGRMMDVALRLGALALTNQFKMKLAEQKHGSVKIVGYRFDEKAEVKEDVNDIRFAFSPCWARVGKQFIFCSTIELCRELIDLLEAEQKAPGKSLRYTAHDRYYGAGVADLLGGIEDQLVTQAILDQAIEPAEAKKQVKQALALVRSLGRTTSYSDYGEKSWRYEFRFGK